MRTPPKRVFFWAECSDSKEFWLAFIPIVMEAPYNQRAQTSVAQWRLK
jgi:hypothetical protein